MTKIKGLEYPKNYITMINRIFISVVLMLWSAVGATCQTQPSKWMAQAYFGIEQHDKRLFHYPDRDYLLDLQPHKWGTYHFGLNVNYGLIHFRKLSLLAGSGVSFELATFNRPFDHSLFNKDLFRILRYENSYLKLKIPLKISIRYIVVNKIFLSGEIISNFVAFRRIDQTGINSEYFPYKESTFELNDVNFKLGINYCFKKYFIGINSRVVNFQKIDKIIFNSLIEDPRVDQKWEWYNPLRFDISFGYFW